MRDTHYLTHPRSHSLISFSSDDLCCATKLLDLAGSSHWRALRRVVSGILELLCCHLEACTRDNNMILCSATVRPLDLIDYILHEDDQHYTE
jgi:hypothetical protein